LTQTPYKTSGGTVSLASFSKRGSPRSGSLFYLEILLITKSNERPDALSIAS